MLKAIKRLTIKQLTFWLGCKLRPAAITLQTVEGAAYHFLGKRTVSFDGRAPTRFTHLLRYKEAPGVIFNLIWLFTSL